ncbi:MAG: rRNA maturation RNase YbeY [Defluviitaleaceae bacterium]|nr:rRNA maturation RNase YbeY [Defluviitaleaceae bacterium]
MKNWEILTENNGGEMAAAYEDVAKKAVFAVLAAENIVCDGEISLVFLADEEMQELNNQYRGKDATTDCLSFPQFGGDELALMNKPGGYVMLGDIVININKAETQAAEYGHSMEREVAFLAVHSVLHLLGYDHEEECDEGRMNARQEEILAEMGLRR